VSHPPAPATGERPPIYRHGEPVHVDSSGYFMTPSGAAYGTLPGRMKLHRAPDGVLEITSEPSSRFAKFLTTVLLAAALCAFPAVLALLVRSDVLQLILFAFATLIAAVVLVLGFFGVLSPRAPLHAYNPLARWDPKDQTLSFDAGRVRIGMEEVRTVAFEHRWVRHYHNSSATVASVNALWITVDEGEYATLPLPALSGSNQRIIRELMNQLPIATRSRD